jgi:hypothetical protein
MKPEDDPEARIRELERPLTDQARSSELGAGQSTSGGAYIPPPAPAYNAPDYTAPTYGAPPPYGTQYPAPYPAPRRKVSGGIPWLVFGLIAVVFVAIAAGFIVFTTRMAGFTTPDDSGVSGGSGSIDIPSIPSIEIPRIPAPPGAPGAEPEVISPPPGGEVSVSGIENNKTVVCNDGSVNISGIRNTVNITGHCVKVTVSGMNNIITVDNADAIGASGFDNRITFHSGEPQIDSTDSNIVEQG